MKFIINNMSYYRKQILSHTYVLIFILYFLLLLFFACEKFEPKRIVKVETVSITNIEYRSCTAQGNIIDVGENGITQHGFCWSKSQDPTLADNKKELGPKSSPGEYSDFLTELSPNTTYYIKAFARSHDEEFYGDQKSFVTLSLREPTVITTAVHNITQNSAQCGGEVLDDGGAEIIMRGVCWSTITEPTIADSFTEDGIGTGSFISNMTGLTPGTIYYVRAYATNSAGTGYGQEEDFETEWGQSGIFNDPREGGHEYQWVRIGDQIWMAENLAYLPSLQPFEHSITEPHYNVYGYYGGIVSEAKATDNYNNYGVMYNWPAAMVACPDGWHLPSDDEWKQLEMSVGMSQEEADIWGIDGRGTNEGSKLSGNSSLWYSGSGGDLVNNPDFGSSGFTALPGGRCDEEYDVYFFLISSNGYYWTSTERPGYYEFAWNRHISALSTNIGRFDNWLKHSGFSVRCVKD